MTLIYWIPSAIIIFSIGIYIVARRRGLMTWVAQAVYTLVVLLIGWVLMVATSGYKQPLAVLVFLTIYLSALAFYIIAQPSRVKKWREDQAQLKWEAIDRFGNVVGRITLEEGIYQVASRPSEHFVYYESYAVEKEAKRALWGHAKLPLETKEV
jgi:hypothetical protein